MNLSRKNSCPDCNPEHEATSIKAFTLPKLNGDVKRQAVELQQKQASRKVALVTQLQKLISFSQLFSDEVFFLWSALNLSLDIYRYQT